MKYNWRDFNFSTGSLQEFTIIGKNKQIVLPEQPYKIDNTNTFASRLKLMINCGSFDIDYTCIV